LDFHGVKVAIIVEGKLLMHLRDNKPGLFNANRWDFPGGVREGTETPPECAIRETEEEFGIVLKPEAFVWEKLYPAQKDPNQKAYFMVAKMSLLEIKGIHLTEGQAWQLFDIKNFFEDEAVIDALKNRFRDYLENE